MPTKGTRPKKRQPTDEQLITAMERMAPSKARLRRLVKKHPAPQEWYDQDRGNGRAQPTKK